MFYYSNLMQVEILVAVLEDKTAESNLRCKELEEVERE